MIYLFLLCYVATLASANPLANFLLQSRLNSNQNGLNNVLNNLQMQANNIQNYKPSSSNQNLINYCPSNQPNGPQNGLPFQIKVDDTNKSYLNKLLANPMFQNILNPNANNYNENSNTLPSHHGQTPNIINNYYIIPPECFQGNEKGIEMIKNLVENHALTCKNEEISKNSRNERNNMQRPQNKQNREIVKGNKRVQNSENGQIKLNNNNNSQPRRENTKKKNNFSNQRNSNHDRKKSKSKDSKVNHENVPNKENVNLSSRNGTRKRKNPKIKSGNDTISIKNSTNPNELSRKVHDKNKKNQTTVMKHPRDDSVVNDIHMKFPGIPKDVIKRLLKYLRRQKQIQNLCNGNGFKSCAEKNCQKNIKTNDNKRKNSRNNSRDSVKLDKTHIAVKTDNISAINNQTSTNDTEVVNNADVSQVDTGLNITENYNKSDNIYYKPVTEDIEITTNKIIQPQNQEDNAVHELVNDVNDYYPDFRFDKMYMSEDDYIRNLRNDKFYYTTDKSEIDESSEMYYKPYSPDTSTKQLNHYSINKKAIEYDEFEDTLSKPNKDYENYDYDQFSNNFSSEEIEFQTPPYLEYPDFETKPILRQFDEEIPAFHKIKSVDSLNVKSSTYSEAKTVSAPLKDKSRNDNIETVFAGSKVAKYGQQNQKIADDLEKNDDSDTVVVYARSISEILH